MRHIDSSCDESIMAKWILTLDTRYDTILYPLSYRIVPYFGAWWFWVLVFFSYRIVLWCMVVLCFMFFYVFLSIRYPTFMFYAWTIPKPTMVMLVPFEPIMPSGDAK